MNFIGKFNGCKRKKLFPLPLLPLLYNMSFVCKQDDCYHSFLRVTGTARAEKKKIPPRETGSRSGKREKVYMKNE